LSADWADDFPDADAHVYGDLALTRYYDPADDRGLADAWMEADD
jgi:hypothetical protein